MRRAAEAAEAAAGGGAAAAIDLAHLERATFGDAALKADLLALFERQALRLAAEIAAAPDARARAEAAHSLRGAALGIGAGAVAEAAGAVEAAGEDAAAFASALAALHGRIAEARTAVAALLGRS